MGSPERHDSYDDVGIRAEQTSCVGIDLGTTHSLVSVFENGSPKLIPNSLGDSLTPSIVGVLPSGEVIVGAAARDLQVTSPESCVATFKRYMGQDREISIGDRAFSPHEISSFVLRSLREDASAYLGRDVSQAVITVPAYFNDHQRQATRLAGEMAGLEVARMINEPTAASLVYGFHDRDGEKNVCVIDLGGGTFDVTVMEIFEGTLEIKATAGESMLGGEDFTDRLVAGVLEQHSMQLETAEWQHPLLVARLRAECEKAKRSFSLPSAQGKPTIARIRLPDQQGLFENEHAIVEMTHESFAKKCKPLLDRLTGPISRALRDAKLAPTQIDEVILVGGATRMPMIREHIADVFGKLPIMEHNPDEVVALGASVQAALIEQDAGVDDMVMTDVCPFTLGVEIVKEFGGHLQDGYFQPVLHRNSTIPVSREETFSTVTANQTEVTLRVFQGDARKVTGNLELGSLTIKDLPPGPAGSVIYVRFSYDLSGVLEVEAYAPGGKKFRTVLTQHVQGLSNEKVAQARARIERLKFYPREDMAAQRLMRFAERIVGELHPSQRQQLDEAIDRFEDAIARGDRELFAAAYDDLMLTLSALGVDLEEMDVEGNSSEDESL